MTDAETLPPMDEGEDAQPACRLPAADFRNRLCARLLAPEQLDRVRQRKRFWSMAWIHPADEPEDDLLP